MSTIEESETEVELKNWITKKMSARDKMDIGSIVQNSQNFHRLKISLLMQLI